MYVSYVYRADILALSLQICLYSHVALVCKIMNNCQTYKLIVPTTHSLQSLGLFIVLIPVTAYDPKDL